MAEVRRITKQEWLDEGERLFGADMWCWQFVCPSCGHVQSPEDFRQYKDQGATPDDARFNCIGRFNGHIHVDAFGGPGSGPCNYTSGGLLNISPVRVTDRDEQMVSFDFYRGPKSSDSALVGPKRGLARELR